MKKGQTHCNIETDWIHLFQASSFAYRDNKMKENLKIGVFEQNNWVWGGGGGADIVAT